LSDWCRDFGWREHSGSHLVQKWLKDVMVTLIDQNDVRIGSSERARRGDTGKAATDNNDAGKRKFRGWC
jgi:hypothetical protein